MPPNAHSADIVLRGNFNPAILHPAWFGAYGLIHKSEAENAKLTVVSPQLTMFETDWFRLSANTDRFHVTASEEPHFEPLRDLVHGVFTLFRAHPRSCNGDQSPLRVQTGISEGTAQHLQQIHAGG